MAATRQETVSYDLFKWVVTGLLGVLVAGLGYYLSGIRDDIGGLKKETNEITKVLNANHLDLTKSIGTVREQSAITNGRLELVVEELKRGRR